MGILNVIIDLSHQNGVVDFSKLNAGGIRGVIHKATQGTSFVDRAYSTNKAKALGQGLLWGAYHFGTGGDGVVQAEHFLNTVNPAPHELLVLDFERDPHGAGMSLDEARAFTTHVHARTGRWPGLYSGEYIKELLGAKKDPILANCWFWLAQYGPTAVIPANWATWTLWQYTDGAKGSEPHEVPGVGRCDRDKFNGDEAMLHRLWGMGTTTSCTEDDRHSISRLR